MEIVPVFILNVLSWLPSLLPRLTYWVMLQSGAIETSVSYDTAIGWVAHLIQLDSDSARAFCLAAQHHS